MDENMYKFRPDIDELVDMIKNGLDDNSFTDMLLAKCEQLRPHLKSEQDELKIELADYCLNNDVVDNPEPYWELINKIKAIS